MIDNCVVYAHKESLHFWIEIVRLIGYNCCNFMTLWFGPLLETYNYHDLWVDHDLIWTQFIIIFK